MTTQMKPYVVKRPTRHERITSIMESMECAQAVAELMTFFDFAHLPERLQFISKPFADIAFRLVAPDSACRGAQLELALQRLIEAKDAAIRSALL